MHCQQPNRALLLSSSVAGIAGVIIVIIATGVVIVFDGLHCWEQDNLLLT
jgi:hypothetical protein